MTMASPAGDVDTELLLDRLLSASTPTDCLDSLDQLHSLCRRRRTAPKNDPKTLRPSEAEALRKAQREAELEEEGRQAACAECLLANGEALHALCGLVASSTLPPAGKGKGEGMEAEGGDVAACELLLAVLPPPPPVAVTSAGRSSSVGGATTEALQKQRAQKRRTERLLQFHEADADDRQGGMREEKLALVPSLLDCLCATTPSVYARVLSLQILQSLLAASPGTLREQLMMAPDGINRLVDLLGHGADGGGGGDGDGGEAPEEVRNQALLFLTSLASSSSVLARLVTFSEGYDRALKIALENGAGGSGLSGGSAVAMDCLRLCLALACADDGARELFLGGGDGRGNLDRLARLMDLRGGERFRDKEKNVWWENELKARKRKKKKTSAEKDTAASLGVKEEEKTAGKRKGKRGKPKEDDLDDILRGASGASTPSTTAKQADSTQESDPQQTAPAQPEGPPIPYLTPNETKIVDSVFDLLLVLLRDGEEDDASSTARSMTDASRSKRRGRARTIMSHESLARYVIDCALYTLPPPGVDYVSAVPHPRLQQKALVVMAALGSLGDTILPEEDAAKSDKDLAARREKEAEEEAAIQTQLLFETYPVYLPGRITAIDRLMFLCCTGAYAPKPPSPDDDLLDDDEHPEVVASLLSTYSIAVFRSCLPAKTASQMVLHALAPPPPDDADEMRGPAEPAVVTRLATTLSDNLRFLQSRNGEELQTPESMVDVCRAMIGASGAAGALGVFLTRGEGEATREMMLRLSVPPPQPPPSLDGGDAAPAEQPSSSFIDFVLHHVATYDPDVDAGGSSSSLNEKAQFSAAYVTVSLLRLLSEWVVGMPRAAVEVLSSPSSVAVGVLLRSRKRGGGDSSTGAADAVPALSGLLLGLCLEYTSTSDGGSSGPSNTENVVLDGPTIMNMIQSMGVGKYLNVIDEFKKRPFPLPYCAGNQRSGMERRAFADWYAGTVTIVRRRVVMAMVGSGGEDGDVEVEGEAGGDVSARSLQRMVTSQAREMEELQARLEEASSTIVTQSAQLKELRRVAELGTSAETNDMISEYTEKLAELEKAKADLKKAAEYQSKLAEDAVAAKEAEMDILREELRVSQASAEELRRDHRTLSEEMSGLSAAYNALEAQYQDSNKISRVDDNPTAAGETAAEDGSPGGEAAAERPERDGRQREVVQSLQEENAQLRKDVQAANEWMSMAVSRMEEMAGENEALKGSLEEAQTSISEGSESREESTAAVERLRGEVDALRKEAEAAKASSEVELKAKDEEINRQQVVAQELEQRLEEMKQSPTKEDTLASLQQVEELEKLRQANKDAQEWMASAVAHVDMLTKQVGEKDVQLEEMAKKLEASVEAGTSNSAASEAKMAELETSLSAITSEQDKVKVALGKKDEELSALQEANEELRKMVDDTRAQGSSKRDALQTELDKVKSENNALQEANEDLRKTTDDYRAQDSSKREALQTEMDKVEAENATLDESRAQICQENEALQTKLDQVNAENATLTSNLAEFHSWSETAQDRLAEVEATLQETAADRDGLKAQLDKVLEGNKSSSQDLEKIASLDKQIREKNEQLARIQDQLIEDSEEHDADKKKLLIDLQAEKLRVEESSAMIDALSLEKELLSTALTEKQAEIDLVNAGKNDVDARVEEANQRIFELEAAKASAEAQLDKLTVFQDEGKEHFDDQIVAITAERNELRSKLDDITEEYEETRNSLECMSIENGNLIARTRALEQDNKSLEYQYTETQGKIKEVNESLAVANDDKSTLQEALEVMKIESEETVQLWKERTQSLEGDIESLEKQLEQQQKEAADAIDSWESRCLTLEGSGEGVVNQWEERVQSLQCDVASLENQLEQQEKEAAEVILQWEERVKSMEGDVVSLEEQLVQKENQANEAIQQWSAKSSDLESLLGDNKTKMGNLLEQKQSLEDRLAVSTSQIDELIKDIESKTETLESMKLHLKEKDDTLESSDEQVSELAKELLETQNQATEAVSLWEERCATLSEEKAQLDANISELEEAIKEQERGANEVISEWEKRCATLNERIEDLELQLVASESDTTVAELRAEVTRIITELELVKADKEKAQKHLKEAKDSVILQEREWCEKEETHASTIKLLQKEKNEALASSDEQVSELTKELQETQNQATEAISLWEERCTTLSEERVQLEANITQLEGAIQDQESVANEAIGQWEARCAALNERIKDLEYQLDSNDKEAVVAELKAKARSLTAKLEANKLDKEKTQEHLKETKELLSLRLSEWEEKEIVFNSSIKKLEGRCLELQKQSDENKSSLDNLKIKCSNLQQERKEALEESEQSQTLVLDLKDELRHAKEELQSFATDQFTVKATEMATQALRQQMVEIRSQYAVDQDALTSEREARQTAESEAERLKSELALLAQATEYNEDIDLHVRKIAKKVSAENVKAERKEMKELRSTLERLREELGSCRWNNHESQEKAANARLQMSILEQEVNAAKIDLQLSEEALEELENAKIEMSVALEYRIGALENERLVAESSHEEQINGIKEELAQVNQERDNLAHKLEQSEKANAALVYSTSHDGLGGEESESEVTKLQLEKAQLLTKINEMGADLERRVREAVAAQASSSEAELIVEKRSRTSVESSLSDVMTELDEVKAQLTAQAANNSNGDLADKDHGAQDHKDLLDEMRMTNEDLAGEIQLLKGKLDTSDKENKSTIEKLSNELQKAEARLRLKDRESRFEAAIASEIANLRADTPASSNGNQKESRSLVLRGIDQNVLVNEGKDLIDRNSAYIIEMYDYVVELKNSITEERQLYEDLLAEHEDLLALLGQMQNGMEGM